MSDRTIDLAKWLCERLSASQNIAMEDRGYCDDCLEDAQKFLAAPRPHQQRRSQMTTDHTWTFLKR
jgi:hypothetical protein